MYSGFLALPVELIGSIHERFSQPTFDMTRVRSVVRSEKHLDQLEPDLNFIWVTRSRSKSNMNLKMLEFRGFLYISHPKNGYFDI